MAMCFYIKYYAVKYICVCQPHLGGFHMPGVYVKFPLSRSKMHVYVGLGAERCNVNPWEVCQKYNFISSAEHKWPCPGIGDKSALSVSLLQLPAVILPIFMCWC